MRVKGFVSVVAISSIMGFFPAVNDLLSQTTPLSSSTLGAPTVYAHAYALLPVQTMQKTLQDAVEIEGIASGLGASSFTLTTPDGTTYAIFIGNAAIHASLSYETLQEGQVLAVKGMRHGNVITAETVEAR